MFRLRTFIFAHLLSSPATNHGCSVQRFLSAAAPSIPPSSSFAVEEHLTKNRGLTRAQVLKPPRPLSQLKPPTNPNAVLAFLSGLGLSTADVAALVAKEPKFLCTSVERTLAPIVVELTDLGLSRSDIARLALVAPLSFRSRSAVSNLPYYLLLIGSYHNILRILKQSSTLLGRSLEKVVKPKVALLRECGLGACDIAKLCISQPWLLTTSLERVHAMVACAESLGVPRGSVAFRHTLQAVAFLSEEKIAIRVQNLKNTFRWSDAQLGIALSKFPNILRGSKDDLQSRSEFLISEAGLEPAYIARRPALLSYSVEGRLRPRYYLLKFLKAKGLLDHDRDYYAAVTYVEKVFVEKFICPHKQAAPHLAEDYEAACRGEVPTRFRFA